jgi:hypothetical protein
MQMQMMMDMMKHMQKDAERKANYDSELLQLAKRDETRKDHREDQKMNFANQAAAVAAFMRPVSAKSFFGGKTLTEVTTTELGKYVDLVATFVETVDRSAGPLNELIKNIRKFTYRLDRRDSGNTGIDSMIAVAIENCKNDQACHTKDKKVRIKEYGERATDTIVIKSCLTIHGR